jgi:hypothetical protein
MRVFPAATLVTVALFLVPSPSPGDSLAEAAKKEKERRKAAQKGKSFTDDDLGRGGGGNVNITTTDARPEGDAAAKPGEAAKSKDKPKTEDEIKAEQSEAWRKKMDTANKKVGVLQDTVNKIQLDLNDMSGGVYSSRRATLLTLLDDTKKQLADAQQSVTDLEAEGRRNGYH